MASFVAFIFLMFTCFDFTHSISYSNDSQAAASRQIDKWQHQYNKYIFKSLKHRTSGCTLDKLQYRREWYVLHGKRGT